MKYIYILLTLLLITTGSGFAQNHLGFSYQSIVRNASNELIANQNIGVQISIIKSSPSGEVIYTETHMPSSNSNGLISLEVGLGTLVNGTFENIEWSNDTYFLKTEIDPLGGSDYSIIGTTQLLSVPYALHSKTADSIVGGINITETDPVFNSSVASKITISDTSKWSNKTIDTHIDSAGIAALGFGMGNTISKQVVTSDLNDSTVHLVLGKIIMRVDSGYLQVSGNGSNVNLGVMVTIKKDQSAAWNGYPTTPRFGVIDGNTFENGEWKDLLEESRGESGIQSSNLSSGLWYYSLYEIELFELHNVSNDSYKISVWVDGWGKVYMRGTYYSF